MLKIKNTIHTFSSPLAKRLFSGIYQDLASGFRTGFIQGFSKGVRTGRELRMGKNV